MILKTTCPSLERAYENFSKYVDCTMPVTVLAENTLERGYSFSVEGGEARVNYSTISSFFVALGCVLAGKTQGSAEMPVKDLGVMIDCARNAVMNVETVKEYACNIVMLGYNYVELYVEDCMKVDGEPVFGYMRGAYTKDELKEIDKFCTEIGVELVPCIQTLAHYNQLIRHFEYHPVRDIDDILLIGDERTHELLENIFRTVRECFTSNRINIGMDEAHNMGKGRYFDLHGYRDKSELFFEHLEYVLGLCSRYGFEPYMWSDMILKNHFKGEYYIKEGDFTDEYVKSVPKGVNFIFWDYYHEDREMYANMLKLHKRISPRLVFAGGAWTWNGFAPLNEYSENTMFPAIEEAVKAGVEDVSFTLWGDNGGECSKFSVLSTLAIFAEKLQGAGDIELVSGRVKVLTGYTYGEMKSLDRANLLSDGEFDGCVCPSKYMLYSDPLVGLMDEYTSPGCTEKYAQHAKEFFELAKNGGKCAYLFQTLGSLCHALEIKAEMGLKLRAAYDGKDKAKMAEIAGTIDECIARIRAFYGVFRAQWMKENKSFGFEINDIRIGGLMHRLSHVKEVIEAYVAGSTDIIPELDENIYPIDKNTSPNGVSTSYNWYIGIPTAGLI